MECYQIQITKPSEKDLKEIFNYISSELQEPEIAKKLISQVTQTIETLERMPFRCALIKDDYLSSYGIRNMLINNYIIFYTASEESKEVIVLRILYNRRCWKELL